MIELDWIETYIGDFFDYMTNHNEESVNEPDTLGRPVGHLMLRNFLIHGGKDQMAQRKETPVRRMELTQR